MSLNYLPYIATEIYCLLYAATILMNMNRSLGSEQEVRALRDMVYSYMAMLLTDIFWAVNEGGYIVLPALPNAAINGVSLIAVALGCYYWYVYIEARLHPAYTQNRIYEKLIRIPIMILVLVDGISIFTGWVFYIDSRNSYALGELFGVQSAITYFYLILSTGTAAVMAVRTRFRQQRREYGCYMLYMLAPLASGIMEDMLPAVPVLALNIFLVIHFLLLTIQNLQIYNDALTSLNNRRRLNQFLESALPKASQEHPLVLYIMDINHFKSINDRYGHVEGDKALKTFAAVLKDAAIHYNAFIARYGGDEFCLVTELRNFTPDEIAADITRRLEKVQESGRAAASYTISVSIGYALCEVSEYDSDSFLARADAVLYENKQRWHREHQQQGR